MDLLALQPVFIVPTYHISTKPGTRNTALLRLSTCQILPPTNDPCVDKAISMLMKTNSFSFVIDGASEEK